MNKNYYDILEVSKNASQDIIEKAYKTLIKKYHPDLQQENLKSEYEEKIKIINEAYEILSNEEKRKNYDLTLKPNEISYEEYNNLLNENIKLKNEINYIKNNNKQINLNNNINSTKINNAINQYSNIVNSKNINYKTKYKNRLKDFLAFFLTIILILIIGFILWNIPFIKNYLINLYNNNSALKLVVDLILNLFNIK